MTNSVNVEAPEVAKAPASVEPAPRRMLTADQILDAPDLEEKFVHVPEWGGDVKIRAFSKAAQQQLRRDATVITIGANGKPEEDVDSNKLERLSFVAGVIEPVFAADQADRLAEKSAKAFDRVLKAIFGLSAMSEESKKAAEKSGSN